MPDNATGAGYSCLSHAAIRMVLIYAAYPRKRLTGRIVHGLFANRDEKWSFLQTKHTTVRSNCFIDYHGPDI